MPNAMSQPTMAFGLFSRRQPNHCIEWIPKPSSSRYFRWDRSVTVDNDNFVARMQKDGNYLVSVIPPLKNRCYGRDYDGNRYTSSGALPPCQYLYIRDGCTVYFVDYELGAPLPPNVVIGGYTSTGLPVYIGQHKDNGWRTGSYTAGSKRFLIYGGIYNGYTEDVKVLVLL